MDPSQAINLVISGVKAAGAVGKFMEQREKRKIVESRRASVAATTAANAVPTDPAEREAQAAAFRRDIFVGMGVLGEKLLTLGAVNEAWLPFAREEALKSLRIKGEPFRAIFEDDMEEAMQYAVTASMFLCASCWPMPVYRGFGACVMNEWRWATADPAYTRPNHAETAQFDDCIALLKTATQGHDVLKGYPRGLTQMSPSYVKQDGYMEAPWYLDPRNGQIKKRGMPQPWDRSFSVTEILWPWATHDSQFALQNRFSYSFGDIGSYLKWQQDPGRMIYGFTVGGFLDLQPGQLVEPTSEIATSILWWLFGLNGTTFRLVYQGALDISSWKMKSKYQKQWDEGLNKAIYAVRDEQLVQQRDAARMSLMSSLPMAPSITPATFTGMAQRESKQAAPEPASAAGPTYFQQPPPQVITMPAPVGPVMSFPSAQPGASMPGMPGSTVPANAAYTGHQVPSSPTQSMHSETATGYAPAPAFSTEPAMFTPGMQPQPVAGADSSSSSMLVSPPPPTKMGMPPPAPAVSMSEPTRMMQFVPQPVAQLQHGGQYDPQGQPAYAWHHAEAGSPPQSRPESQSRSVTMPIPENSSPTTPFAPIQRVPTVPIQAPVPKPGHQPTAAIVQLTSPEAVTPFPAVPPQPTYNPMQPVHAQPATQHYQTQVLPQPAATAPPDLSSTFNNHSLAPQQLGMATGPAQYHQQQQQQQQQQQPLVANPALTNLFAPPTPTHPPQQQQPHQFMHAPVTTTYFPPQQQQQQQPIPTAAATWSSGDAFDAWQDMTLEPQQLGVGPGGGDLPPAYSLRKVEAQFDFKARTGREISFAKGEVLEILRDSIGVGWLLARKGGVEGRIPEAYVTSF